MFPPLGPNTAVIFFRLFNAEVFLFGNVKYLSPWAQLFITTSQRKEIHNIVEKMNPETDRGVFSTTNDNKAQVMVYYCIWIK